MRLATAFRNWTPRARFLYRSREKAFFVRANERIFEANMIIRREKYPEAFKLEEKKQYYYFLTRKYFR